MRDEKNKITVMVYGPAGSGKSTITNLLIKQLQKYDIDGIVLDNEATYDTYHPIWDKRANNIGSHTEVEIKIVNINRTARRSPEIIE